MMKVEERQLRKFFNPEMISFKVVDSGVDVHRKPFVEIKPYVSTMTAIKRLDAVFGIHRWKTELAADGKTIVGISIESNGVFVTKHNTVKFLEDQLPGALELGIGRYLFDVKPFVVEASTDKEYGTESCTTPERVRLYYSKPTLPKEYLKPNKITPKQSKQIDDLVEEIGKDTKEYLENLGVNSFSQLDESEAVLVIGQLEKALKKNVVSDEMGNSL